MSLINDALKKAQRQRHGDDAPAASAPVPGGGPRPAIETGRSADAPKPVALIAAGVVGAAAVVAVGAFFALRPTADQAAPTVAKAESPAPAAPVPSPTPLPAADPVVLTVPVPVPPPTPVVAAPPPAAPVAPVAPPPAPAVASGPPPSPSSRFVAAADAFRVVGIRAAGADSKVLMNDRVYRVGDMVDHDFGIRLTGATANSLTFTDGTGASYTRYF